MAVGVVHIRLSRSVGSRIVLSIEEIEKMSGTEKNDNTCYTRLQGYSIVAHPPADVSSTPSTSTPCIIAWKEPTDNLSTEKVSSTEQNSSKKNDASNANGKKTAAEPLNNDSTSSNPRKRRGPQKTPTTAKRVRSASKNETIPNPFYVTARDSSVSDRSRGWQETERRDTPKVSTPTENVSQWQRRSPNPAVTFAPQVESRGFIQSRSADTAVSGSVTGQSLRETFEASLACIDPQASYQVEFIPPQQGRLTLTRVDTRSLPPPPVLNPYGGFTTFRATHNSSIPPPAASPYTGTNAEIYSSERETFIPSSGHQENAPSYSPQQLMHIKPCQHNITICCNSLVRTFVKDATQQTCKNVSTLTGDMNLQYMAEVFKKSQAQAQKQAQEVMAAGVESQFRTPETSSTPAHYHLCPAADHSHLCTPQNACVNRTVEDED